MTHFHGERLGRLYPNACRAAPTYQPLYEAGMTVEDVERKREEGLALLEQQLLAGRSRRNL
jgi:hypothetical protein